MPPLLSLRVVYLSWFCHLRRILEIVRFILWWGEITSLGSACDRLPGVVGNSPASMIAVMTSDEGTNRSADFDIIWNINDLFCIFFTLLANYNLFWIMSCTMTLFSQALLTPERDTLLAKNTQPTVSAVTKVLIRMYSFALMTIGVHVLPWHLLKTSLGSNQMIWQANNKLHATSSFS